MNEENKENMVKMEETGILALKEYKAQQDAKEFLVFKADPEKRVIRGSLESQF